MKNLLIFLSAVLSGIVLMLIASNLTTPKPQTPLVTPTSASPIPSSGFSLENAPKNSLKVQVLSMSGKILFQDRVATQPAEVKTLNEVQQGETLVTDKDGSLKAQIPGQLNITLSPKTELEFAQTLPTNIVLNQNKGQVEYQKTGSGPASVRTNGLLVEIDGTDLTITVNDDQSKVTVVSSKGPAKVAYNDSNDLSTVKTLSEGDTLIFDTATKTSRLI